MKKQKIIEDNILHEEEEEGDEEDEFVEEEAIEEEGMPFDEIGYSKGPLGQIYPSSSSGEEEVEDEKGRIAPKRLYVPRCKI